ncbi:hypothetical protein ANN_22694 [Periplaneta americana]|uniref:Zinc finger PHD-type domain-containing protein n=1 Tax=Periplaneta americana TaxID=6978 RepID=A0ABQ8S980_PERAM|nr:hypothetical protein ANN_22694 [Periplaneta americana]
MPRKLNARGRRAGRTRIATDTPEKEEISNRVPSSSSSEDEPVPLVSTDEDSTDEACIFCNQAFCKDTCGEQWIRCLKCLRWSHELCAGVDKGAWKKYMCVTFVNKYFISYSIKGKPKLHTILKDDFNF